MSRRSLPTIVLVLLINTARVMPNAAAQSDPYPKMAPLDQYLMEKTAEIQLARSAAPDSISRDATILILGRQGYETAVQGKNGFVCMVERGWMGMFDWPEFWSPKVRAADCLNPQPEGEGRGLSEPAGCAFDIADRLSTHQDGDGRSFEGGDRVGSQSGVREETTAEP